MGNTNVKQWCFNSIISSISWYSFVMLDFFLLIGTTYLLWNIVPNGKMMYVYFFYLVTNFTDQSTIDQMLTYTFFSGFIVLGKNSWSFQDYFILLQLFFWYPTLVGEGSLNLFACCFNITPLILKRHWFLAQQNV